MSNLERAKRHAQIAEEIVAKDNAVSIHKGALAAAHATLALFYRDLTDDTKGADDA